jgi:hypothetical protein
MCDPVTMTVLTVASTAGSLYAQQQAADQQAAANRTNFNNQMTAYRYNLANANATKVQEAENLSQKKMEINSDVMRKQATATVAAGEAGVSGLSVDSLLASIGAEGGRAAANAEVNYLRTDRAIETDKMNMWAGTATNIGQMKTPQSPDYLGSALKIGTAVDTYKRGGK